MILTVIITKLMAKWYYLVLNCPQFASVSLYGFLIAAPPKPPLFVVHFLWSMVDNGGLACVKIHNFF